VTTDLDGAWRLFLDATGRDWDRFRTWSPAEFPHVSEGRQWRRLPVQATSRWLSDDVYDHGNWTAGFAIGTAALLYAARPDAELAGAVGERIALLAERARDTTTHDIGFLFHPSFVVAEAVGLLDVSETAPALRAAHTLARRFNPWGRFLQAFGPVADERSAGTSTVDTMMNLPLLWWASQVAPEPRLFVIAHEHALSTARVFVRPDGSTYHLVKYDPLVGSVMWRGTYQGASSDSCWSRGQAWTTCGAAWAFAATRDSELLDLAEQTAAYFWERLPDDGVPPWDFGDTTPEAPEDASASAVAALGALVLGRAHPDRSAAERYETMARDLLLRLAENAVNEDPEVEGVLLRSCYSRPHGIGIDGAMAWGDFYLGLALAVATSAVSLAAVGCPAPAAPADDRTEDK
jgi:unsaturated chondroitin disaccharide hydrolase